MSSIGIAYKQGRDIGPSVVGFSLKLNFVFLYSKLMLVAVLSLPAGKRAGHHRHQQLAASVEALVVAYRSLWLGQQP